MAYRDRVLARIQRATAADTDDVVEFRRRVYGPDAFFSRPDYIAWMYGDGSTPTAGPSPLWLYRPDSTIEGHQGGVRAIVSVEGRPVDALWATELVVSPDYLMRGAGAVLSSLATSESSLVIGFEVTDLAKQAFLRAGWSDLGDVPLYVRPLDVATLLDERGRRLPGPLAVVANALLRVADRATAALTARWRAALTEVSQFDERSDTVWRSASPHYGVVGVRDAATLNWRYADYPESGRYRLFYAYRRRELVGHVVLRTGDHRGVRAGWIVDFLCEPSDAYWVLSAAVRWLARERVSAVYCIQGPALARAFATAGFVRRSTSWPLMTYAAGLSESERAVVIDPANWFITAGDGNVDHPREGTVYAT